MWFLSFFMYSLVVSPVYYTGWLIKIINIDMIMNLKCKKKFIFWKKQKRTCTMLPNQKLGLLTNFDLWMCQNVLGYWTILWWPKCNLCNIATYFHLLLYCIIILSFTLPGRLKKSGPGTGSVPITFGSPFLMLIPSCIKWNYMKSMNFKFQNISLVVAIINMIKYNYNDDVKKKK